MVTAPQFIETDRAEMIRRTLLDWYDEAHRSLPWRTEPTEYKTVISEFMLQQTRVQTVLPYFEAFLDRFPSFAALARASEEQVLAAWSGLGYYRRARMLKRAAERIVRCHGGRLPPTAEALAELPGFGPYTVGAVGSIALGLVLPLVDGNVRRVVGRLFALEGDLRRGGPARGLWAICAGLVDPERPGDFNQALMELGATVCFPREPLCLICPMFTACRARQLGFPENYPQKMRRPPTRRLREVAVALMRRGKVLVLQRGEAGAFAGLWELPRLDTRTLEDDRLGPERVLREVVRLRAEGFEAIGTAEATFTHHRIRTELYRAQAPPGAAVRRCGAHVAHKWVAPSRLDRLPGSRAQRNLFELIREHA